MYDWSVYDCVFVWMEKKKDWKGMDWEEEESLGIEIFMLCIFIVVYIW